jgi:hypothetical protein
LTSFQKILKALEPGQQVSTRVSKDLQGVASPTQSAVSALCVSMAAYFAELDWVLAS